MRRADLAPGQIRGQAAPVRTALTLLRPAALAGCFIAASAWLVAMPAHADQLAIPSPWEVDCHAGEDGFAHNCEAVLAAGDYVLRLASADAQVFVAILHPSCETEYRNFDRTDLVGRDPAARRALIEQAFREIEAEIRRACPSLAPPAPALDAMPDIAILSPETPG